MATLLMCIVKNYIAYNSSDIVGG